RDYGDKFAEYQNGGVQEYWIIDPMRRECVFYRLNEADIYKSIYAATEELYQTPLLDKFSLYVPTLWQDSLPDTVDIVDAVRAMFEEND
ncbi:MAG TPA: Uma2 family endonuclease, partial [Aggregatilineales bacterium]|nr:Uma2 family endonuclease [Aggregatilineales bacterium]